jgi:7-carboxy-7-deazaguanine synthase
VFVLEKESLLKVDDIFVSMQGESSDTGRLTTFVRFYGCNIKCGFCDQPQDYRMMKEMSLNSLIEQVKYLGMKYVCITGGEPLLQWDGVYPFILELVSEGYKVSIETSGCVPIEEDNYKRSFRYVMDIKCPSSGVEKKNIFENLRVLHKIDEVKFVIANRKDYNFMLKVLEKYPTLAQILVSPCFTVDMKMMVPVDNIINWLIKDGFIENVRIQTQLHKLLNLK